MKDKEPTSRDPLPDDFSTLDEFWSFWDNHSSADYEDGIEPVEVLIDLPESLIVCVGENGVAGIGPTFEICYQ